MPSLYRVLLRRVRSNSQSSMLNCSFSCLFYDCTADAVVVVVILVVVVVIAGSSTCECGKYLNCLLCGTQLHFRCH